MGHSCIQPVTAPPPRGVMVQHAGRRGDDVGGVGPSLRGGVEHAAPGRRAAHARDVALQVAFERQILKPIFSLDRL
jgi:hypothetical protein